MKTKTLLIGAAMMFAVTASAQEPAASAQPKAVNETAQLLSMAGELVKYGYKTQNALPLVQAVQIYKSIGVVPEAEAKKKEIEGQKLAEARKAKNNPVQYDQARLIADATAYADGDENILGIIKGLGDVRGRVGGETYHMDVVDAGLTDVYTMRFQGGEDATIILSSDGDTDLDLYVYDENDNLIGYDDDGTDDCVVSFTPRWTGNFKIKVKNLGDTYNSYTLITN
jgi:hypothetical protein